MQNSIETIYILENPEKNMVKFATGYQLRYNDIIKEVFGVACVNDLSMMLHFNRTFQESICNKYGISDNKISLHQIIRIASKSELLQLKTELIDNCNLIQDLSAEEKNSIARPFDSVIKLQEGIFRWDDLDGSYNLVKAGA